MKLTNLSILTVALALVLWTSGANAHDVRPGEKVRGEVAGAGAVELLDIDLAVGDELKLTIKGQGVGGSAPAIALLDPDGNRVASASDERKLKLAHVAGKTGTYQIELRTFSTTSSRFTLKVRGDESRSYSSRDRALEFGVRAGSRIDVKVKSKGESVVSMYDSNDDDVSASYRASGRKARATVGSAAETDDYEIAFGPAGAKAKVKVRYPEARGALEITMNATAGGNGSYSPPAAQGDDDEDAPEDSEDPEDPVADNGDTTGDVNDGTVGGGSGDGTVPAPAALTDHAYLTDLLLARTDAELERVRVELGRMADRPMSEVIEALEMAISEPIAGRIHEALLSHWDDESAAPAIGMMLDLVAAQRRADRAQRALSLLTQEMPNSTLAGDPAYDAGQAMFEAGLSGLTSAIDEAVNHGLRLAVEGGEDPNAPSLEAPVAAPASNEMLAGLAALDAAALNGAIMARARLLEPAAIELASVLYEGYESRLTQNLSPNAAATLAAVQQARTELQALSQQVFGEQFEIALINDPKPAANEAYSLWIVAFGPSNASQVEFVVEGAENDGVDGLDDGADAPDDGADAPDDGIDALDNGIMIHMPGQAGPHEVVVRASYAGIERVLIIEIEPRQNAGPAADLTGRIVDANGQGMAAHWELRTLEDEMAENADGQILAGETDGEGHFGAPQVRAGDWVLVIHVDEQDEIRIPVTTDENTLDLGEIVID